MCQIHVNKRIQTRSFVCHKATNLSAVGDVIGVNATVLHQPLSQWGGGGGGGESST